MPLPSLSDLIPRIHWAGRNPEMFPCDIPLRAVADHAIFYILEGEGRARIGNESYDIHAGDLLYCPPRTAQMIDSCGGTLRAYVWIHFGVPEAVGSVRHSLARELVGIDIENVAPALIEKTVALHDAKLAPLRRHGALAGPRELALDIARLVRQDVESSHGDAVAGALARARLIELIARYIAEPHTNRESGGPAPHARRLEWLFAELETRLAEPDAGGIETLAARVRVSPRQFRRLCRSVFGRGPQRIVDDLRLRRACLLLQTREPRRTIASIALECGFEDALYFSRWFNRRMGQSPTAYAAKNEDDDHG